MTLAPLNALPPRDRMAMLTPPCCCFLLLVLVNAFVGGMVETSHIFYYATITWVALTLATKVLERRRFM